MLGQAAKPHSFGIARRSGRSTWLPNEITRSHFCGRSLPAVFEQSSRVSHSSEALLTDTSEARLGHALEAYTVTRAAAQAIKRSAAQAIALRDA